MPAPEINRPAGGIKFTWADYQLAITLDRFRDAGGRGSSAEFTATTTAPGYSPLLTQAQLNLTALRTRTEFVKRLRALYKEANWDEVMETVCVLGLRHFRQGEPVLRLTEQSQIAPPPQRLTPLVHDGLPTVLFAPGGTGKSYLALFCAMLVQTGGWEGSFCGIPGETLYLDYESEVGDLIERAKRIRRGHPKLADAEPSYRRCHVPLADDLQALQRYVAESNINFLVIDSLAAACGAELERAETAIRLFNALRSLRVASLILAHVAKNSEEKSIYGSVFFSNFARSVWEMKKVQEAGDAMTRVGLYHRKCNLGPLHKPIGLRLNFGEGVQFEPLDLTEEPTLAEGLPLPMRLKTALRAGARSSKELAAELNVSVASVKARLSDGQGKWSRSMGDGKWGLLDERG